MSAGLAVAALFAVAGCEAGGPPAGTTRGIGATTEPAAPLAHVAAAARGFPAMWDTSGAPLASGAFARWVEEGRLHILIRYDFEDGRIVEEAAAFAPGPPLTQSSWTWTETRDGDVVRRFEADLDAGTASAERHEEGEVEREQEAIEVEAGTTFAGFGFTLALQSLRERLVDGEVVELDAVAFAFGPRVVAVEVSHGGTEEMRMGSRVLTGDRFEIAPQIPALVDLFVEVPVTKIWLTNPTPAEFLRWEGPLVEPDDPIVRVDLLPGTESGPAQPTGRAPAP